MATTKGYIICDLQIHGREFADGEIFDSLKEVVEQMIDFHSIDCDMTAEAHALKQGEIDKAVKMIKDFEWDIKEVEVEVCPNCKGKYQVGREALSRRDGSKICPRCGMGEALEDYIKSQN